MSSYPHYVESLSATKKETYYKLDVRRCLIDYLEKTKDWSKSTAMFVLLSGPNKAQRASKQPLPDGSR